jgi:hypothetical protein
MESSDAQLDLLRA